MWRQDKGWQGSAKFKTMWRIILLFATSPPTAFIFSPLFVADPAIILLLCCGNSLPSPSPLSSSGYHSYPHIVIHSLFSALQNYLLFFYFCPCKNQQMDNFAHIMRLMVYPLPIPHNLLICLIIISLPASSKQSIEQWQPLHSTMYQPPTLCRRTQHKANTLNSYPHQTQKRRNTLKSSWL